MKPHDARQRRNDNEERNSTPCLPIWCLFVNMGGLLIAYKVCGIRYWWLFLMYSILENFWNDDKMKLMTTIDGERRCCFEFWKRKESNDKKWGKRILISASVLKIRYLFCLHVGISPAGLSRANVPIKQSLKNKKEYDVVITLFGPTFYVLLVCSIVF